MYGQLLCICLPKALWECFGKHLLPVKRGPITIIFSLNLKHQYWLTAMNYCHFTSLFFCATLFTLATMDSLKAFEASCTHYWCMNIRYSWHKNKKNKKQTTRMGCIAQVYLCVHIPKNSSSFFFFFLIKGVWRTCMFLHIYVCKNTDQHFVDIIFFF